MKKIILKIGILAILAMIILPSIQVYAQSNSYTVLAPLPGTTESDNTTTLAKYLPGLFNLLIGLAAVAAVLNIVIGGFQYMSTDAIQGKSAGKERIKNAIFSLVLIIAAWLILYTINPNLLTLNLNISAVTTTAPAGVTLGNISTPGTPMTQEDIANSNLVRTGLALGGVNTYRDPCTEGQTTNCVNLNGLTNVTTTGLIALKQDCTNCSVLITGGTEGGHSENSQHYTGSAVDLNPNVALDSYITTGHTPTQTAYGPVYTLKINGQDVTFLNETVNAPGSTGAHWHVTFH